MMNPMIPHRQQRHLLHPNLQKLAVRLMMTVTEADMVIMRSHILTEVWDTKIIDHKGRKYV